MANVMIARAETVHISANFRLPNPYIVESSSGSWRTRGGHLFENIEGWPRVYLCRRCQYRFLDAGDPILLPHCRGAK